MDRTLEEFLLSQQILMLFLHQLSNGAPNSSAADLLLALSSAATSSVVSRLQCTRVNHLKYLDFYLLQIIVCPPKNIYIMSKGVASSLAQSCSVQCPKRFNKTLASLFEFGYDKSSWSLCLPAHGSSHFCGLTCILCTCTKITWQLHHSRPFAV